MSETNSPVRKLPRVRRRYLEHKIANSKASQEALKRLAAWLREQREARNLSLMKLADEVGCSFKQIHNIEKAQNWPSMPLFIAICRFFNHPVPPLI